MPLISLAGGSARLGRAQGGAAPTPPADALQSVPEGWSLVAEWNNPANLSPSAPLSFSGESGTDNVSSIASSGYGDAPPYGGPNVVARTAEEGGSDVGSDFGNLGIDTGTLSAACFVHIWKWPSTTDGESDGYPYSWVNGGNKQAFFPSIGTGRVYSVVRAQVPFDTYDSEENYRQVDLALEGFSPVEGIGRPVGETDEDYLIDLNEWMIVTAVVDLRPSQGSRIARLYLGKGSNPHVLMAEATNLTSPGSSITSAYVNNTNNGRTDSLYPFTGTMYDAYFGVFAP